MAQEVIGFCPICNERLIVTKLSCKCCCLEMVNEFSLSKFNYLTKEDLLFLEYYLKYKGNLKILQKILDISYSNAKKQLESILSALGLLTPTKKSINTEVIFSQLPIYNDESNAIKLIKEKLNKSNGKATITLSRGGSFDIYYDSFGNGLIATNVPKTRILTWKAFDSAIEIITKNNGRAMKGQAMKAKLGEPDLSLDTVEGFVANQAYGVKKGESTLRMISALSSILDWAGICNNGYGYLELKKGFKS